MNGTPDEARIRRLAATIAAGLATVQVTVLAPGCAGTREFTGFETSDGIYIAGDLHVPARSEGGGDARAAAPVVVLAHELYRDRRAWDPLVPDLLAAGYAVLAIDRRGSGESTREAASPGALSEAQKRRFHLDLLEAIAEIRDFRGVDASRVAIVASGMSVGSAVTTATLDPSVRLLVLMTGLIPQEEEEFLLARPEFPVLLLAASGHERGVSLMRQYGRRIAGPPQRYIELEPADPAYPADWEGTEGLVPETGLGDVILWYLHENLPPDE